MAKSVVSTGRATALHVRFSVLMPRCKGCFAALAFLLVALSAIPSYAATYQYFRVGNKEDVQTTARPGIAMMGCGKDLDEAFRWLCGNAGGGDFLILRAHGDDDYNSYVNGLCKANSV